MTIARAYRPPTQASCRRLAGRWWIAQHPPRRVLRNSLLARRSVEDAQVSERRVNLYPRFSGPS